jgi:hypothetical protein
MDHFGAQIWRSIKPRTIICCAVALARDRDRHQTGRLPIGWQLRGPGRQYDLDQYRSSRSVFGVRLMILIYKIALVLIVNTTPVTTDTVVYSMATWQLCKAKQADLIEGMKGRAHPENATVDCRRNVQINLGDPNPPEAETGAGF